MSPEAASEATAHRHGRVRLAGTLVLALFALLIGLAPRLDEGLQSAWFDACQRWSPRQVDSMPAVVVEIDPRSLAALGRWPWPRDLLARLVDQIQRHGPAAIGLDILMPEPDPLSPERVLERLAEGNPQVRRELAGLPSNDAMLARALARAPAVLAIAGTPEATGMLLRVAPFALQDASGAGGTSAPLVPRLERHAGALTSLEVLDRAASGHGLISVEPTEGVIRRIPLVASIDGTLAPALAVEMLRVAIGAPSLRLLVSGHSAKGIGIAEHVVPTEPDGAARVHFSPRNARRFLSAVDVLEGKVDPDRLERKLVLIGVTSLGLGEYHSTPIGERMPGSEIHVQLLENLFDRYLHGTPLLTRPAWGAPLEAGAFLVLGALLVWTTPAWRPRNATLLALACAAILLAAAYQTFRAQRLLLDAATPALALLALFGALLVMTLSEATRQRKALQRAIQVQRERNAHLAGELEAGRRIQTATLPSPDVLREERRVELAAAMVPAREVGGDLYDFFRLDADRLFFMIGDVAGKGLSASIFMAVSKALCKSAALRAPTADLGALMSAANVEVSRDNPEMLFVTAFAGILDLQSGELAHCSAGHERPWRLRPGEPAPGRLESHGGPPLCVVDDFHYDAGRCRMIPGEALVLVTDGVTEAADPAGELYGTRRLEARLQACLERASSAGEVVEAVRADVEAFAAGAEAADDLTVLVLRWNPPGLSAG